MIDWVDHGISFDSRKVPWLGDENAPKYPGDYDMVNPTPFIQKIVEQYKDQYKDVNDVSEVLQRSYEDELFAPDAIHKDGKYFSFFCLSDGSEGVAVADKPEGPFDDAVQLPCGGIDPAIFIDDDGQAYYYWGQFQAKGVKLKQNMMKFEEGTIIENIVTEEEHYFHEGSSVRKRGDAYYLVYSSLARGKATTLAYATSKSPLGPYKYKRIIIDNDGCDPQSWNNHGSIEEVNGQWYVFYHRNSRNKQAMRRLCVEPIFFNEDGTIPEVKMTSQGAGRPFGIGEKIDAYRACQLSGGIYIAPSENESEMLTGIQDGDEAIFRYVQWGTTVNHISVEARGNGIIKIYLNDEREASGSIILYNGCVSTSSFKGAAGKHEIKLLFEKTNGLEICSISIHAQNNYLG